MPFRLDHLAFAVSDAVASQAALAELGFGTVAGVCRWQARDTEQSARCLSVVFAAHYLDFIESARVMPPRADGLGPYARGIVPSGVILNADALEAALVHVGSLGLEPRAPYEIERLLSAEPATSLRYRFFGLARSAALPIGVIEDLDPDALRHGDRLVHPNGATGIAGVHFRAPDAAAAATWLRRLTGGSDALETVGSASVQIDGVTFHFHSKLDGSWLQEVDTLVARAVPVALLAIEFAVPDLQNVETLLLSSGIRFRTSDTRLLVDPRGGYGCGVVFTVSPASASPSSAPR